MLIPSRRFLRLARDPIGLLMRACLLRLPVDLRTRMQWDLSARPAYLLGLGEAAIRAAHQGVPRICAIEFGVAAGTGLLILEREAHAISQETGVTIHVIGFDAGAGLPDTSGDYRNHPDYWQPGDFPMDVDALRRRLHPETRVILGPVRETVPRFVEDDQDAPVGFVAFDLDLYTSTRDALQIFAHPSRQMLRQVACYFDDIEYFIAHPDAGELRAIREFNETHRDSLILSPWAGVKRHQAFPDREYLNRMYVAHNLDAISRTVLHREIRGASSATC